MLCLHNKEQMAVKEGSRVCAVPPRMSHCSSFQPPAQHDAATGRGSITTLPSVSLFFPLSIQHFKHTQNQVFGIHSSRADMGAVSKVPFQHMTEHSHCNHTQLLIHLKNRKDNLGKL